MVALLFKDRGWEVLSAAWSAASNTDGQVTISYTWLSAWNDAHGTASVEIKISLADLTDRVRQASHVLDLRELQQ